MFDKKAPDALGPSGTWRNPGPRVCAEPVCVSAPQIGSHSSDRALAPVESLKPLFREPRMYPAKTPVVWRLLTQTHLGVSHFPIFQIRRWTAWRFQLLTEGRRRFLVARRRGPLSQP